MKNYEWSNKHTSVRKCPKCGKELEFADMKCPHCGADARTEQRAYRPRLSSADIQTTPKERVGAPQQPQGDYFFKTITSIDFLMTATAVILSAVIGFVVGSVSTENAVLYGILSGVLCALVFILLARAIAVEMKNTAAAARNNERIALGIEYQIQQMNELITAYNRDKEIDGENAEVFAKLLVKIGRLEEAQKNTLEELTNTVGAMSDKLTKLPVAAVEEKSTEEQTEETVEETVEESIEEPAEIAKPEEVSENEPEEVIPEPDETSEPEETLEIEEVIKEAKEIEKEKEEEEALAFDARSAGAEDWDDGFFDKENPTSRLDAFLDEDDD